MRTIGTLAGLTGALCVSMPAAAEDWPNSGPFEVIEASDACAIVGDFSFEGRADVELSLLADADQVLIAFTSKGWSRLADGIEMSYEFFPGQTAEPRSFVGLASGLTRDQDHHGFYANLDSSILEAFAASDSLLVAKGGAPVTHIDLRGSAMAVQTLKRCNAAVQRRLDQRRSAAAQWNDIDADPFSLGSRNPDDPWTPMWLTPPSVTPSDYPATDQARPASGSARVECEETDSGVPRACTLISQSSPGFGDAAIRVVMRARVQPRGGMFRWTVEFPGQ